MLQKCLFSFLLFPILIIIIIIMAPVLLIIYYYNYYNIILFSQLYLDITDI